MELRDLVGRHILTDIETGEMSIPCWWNPKITEDCNYIKFELDGVIYLAVEDPDDGYRSLMRDLQITDLPCKTRIPNLEVECRMMPNSEKYGDIHDVLEFYDVKNNLCVLSVGTMYVDDYYPCCELTYTPENMHFNITS